LRYQIAADKFSSVASLWLVTPIGELLAHNPGRKLEMALLAGGEWVFFVHNAF
jgi:hypothetical protein